jgi:hypothetical protein
MHWGASRTYALTAHYHHHHPRHHRYHRRRRRQLFFAGSCPCPSTSKDLGKCVYVPELVEADLAPHLTDPSSVFALGGALYVLSTREGEGDGLVGLDVRRVESGAEKWESVGSILTTKLPWAPAGAVPRAPSVWNGAVYFSVLASDLGSTGSTDSTESTDMDSSSMGYQSECVGRALLTVGEDGALVAVPDAAPLFCDTSAEAGISSIAGAR